MSPGLRATDSARRSLTCLILAQNRFPALPRLLIGTDRWAVRFPSFISDLRFQDLSFRKGRVQRHAGSRRRAGFLTCRWWRFSNRQFLASRSILTCRIPVSAFCFPLSAFHFTFPLAFPFRISSFRFQDFSFRKGRVQRHAGSSGRESAKIIFRFSWRLLGPRSLDHL